MPPRRVCCNPFKKNKHAQIFKGIRKITSNAKNCCLSFLGKYLCNCCRIQLSKTADEKQVVVKPRQDLTTDLQLDVVSSESDSDWEEEFFGDMKNNRENIADDGKLVEEIKRALDKAQTKQEKLKHLSTVPRSWGVNNIHATLGVSHHIAKKALKIRAALGYGCSPSKNRGRALPKELIKKVHDFYQDDSNSRVMPGQRDYLSVTIDGKKDRVQKRLLLFDLKELHYNFQARHPEVKLSCSKFCKLRPPFCVTVGCSGAHNVCVCKIHQNLKLMFCGLNKELEKDYAIADVIKDMVCPSPDENCFLLQCKSCPGISIAANPIKKQMETQQVQYVHFKNWTCTDRCDIVEKKEEADTFYQTLQVDVPLYMRHDFVARSQSEFFASAKATLADGEYLICLDFSENYAFKIQDAVQSYHWNNNQATLHPYAIYYKNEGVITSECFAAISECNKHDAVAVYLFNQKMIAHLKQKCQNVTKLIFFSDGAASQYKNKYNLINLASFEKDFNVKAEWHFFATSHGKGACDGIGGTVKRLASRASLQRPLDNQITNARKLYEWASESIKNIAFCFCTENEHSDTENFLKERFGKTVTIAGTRMYHSFVPNGSNVITCKKISKSDKFELHKI